MTASHSSLVPSLQCTVLPNRSNTTQSLLTEHFSRGHCMRFHNSAACVKPSAGRSSSQHPHIQSTPLTGPTLVETQSPCKPCVACAASSPHIQTHQTPFMLAHLQATEPNTKCTPITCRPSAYLLLPKVPQSAPEKPPSQMHTPLAKLHAPLPLHPFGHALAAAALPSCCCAAAQGSAVGHTTKVPAGLSPITSGCCCTYAFTGGRVNVPLVAATALKRRVCVPALK